jgi:hypothetical protein
MNVSFSCHRSDIAVIFDGILSGSLLYTSIGSSLDTVAAPPAGDPGIRLNMFIINITIEMSVDKPLIILIIMTN